MAILAGIGGRHVGGSFSFRRGLVVAAETSSRHSHVVEPGLGPRRRIVAVLALVR